MVTRRSFLRTAAVTLGGAALAACGATPTPTPAPTQTAVKVVQTQIVKETQVVEKVITATPVVVPPTPTILKAKVTGTFQMVQKTDYFPEMNLFLRNELVKYFNAQGWNWDISYAEGYSGGTPFVDKMAAASSAGTPPDLMMNDQAITDLWRLKVVDPVTDVVDAITAIFGDTTARQKNDFLFPDKQWYYVPYFQRSDGGWYQENIFKAKNIDLQTVRLYPDLWNACLAVSDPAKQIYGWGVTITCCGDGQWFINRVFHGWGAYIQDATGQFCTVNSPEMVEAVTRIADLYTNPKWAPMLPPGVLAWGNNDNNTNWNSGKLAYTQNAGTALGYTILNNLPIKDVTRYHPPAGGPVNKEFNSLGANYWCIFKGSKNQEAAKLTIKSFMSDVTKMDAILSNAPAFALPAYEKLWDMSKYVPTNKVVLDQKPVATAKVVQIPNQYPGPANNVAIAAADQQCIYADMISQAIKGTPAKDAVKTAHDRYVALFKQFGLAGTK